VLGKGFQSSRSRSRKPLRYSWLVPVGLAASLFVVLYLLTNRARPALAAGARALATRAASEALNAAVTEELTQSSEASRILHIDEAPGGTLRMAHFDFASVTRVQSATVAEANVYLDQLAHQTLHLPVVQTLGGALFSSFGPTLPVRVYTLGSVHSSIHLDTQATGINQTVHALYLVVTAEVQVIAPLVAAPVTVRSEVPLAYVVLSGDVPHTYIGGSLPGPISPHKDGN